MVLIFISIFSESEDVLGENIYTYPKTCVLMAQLGVDLMFDSWVYAYVRLYNDNITANKDLFLRTASTYSAQFPCLFCVSFHTGIAA